MPKVGAVVIIVRGALFFSSLRVVGGGGGMKLQNTALWSYISKVFFSLLLFGLF